MKAAERDALRRSGGNSKNNPDSDIAHFRKLKKQGGETLRSAILTYKARCAATAAAGAILAQVGRDGSPVPFMYQSDLLDWATEGFWPFRPNTPSSSRGS